MKLIFLVMIGTHLIKLA